MEHGGDISAGIDAAVRQVIDSAVDAGEVIEAGGVVDAVRQVTGLRTRRGRPINNMQRTALCARC
jgi:hypothetical protein